jgi:hypothetical protein
MVTVRAEEYVPAAGLKVGIAAGRIMVYAAELIWLVEPAIGATAISILVAETAMALSVSVFETVIGPVYIEEPVVGVAPLVV